MRISKPVIYAVLLGVLLILGIATLAQDGTEESASPDTSTFTDTPVPSDTASPSETPTSTDTATALPSETPSETPALTETATVEVPTSSPIASITGTAELTSTVEPPTASPTLLPPEPPLALLFSDNFDTGDLADWTIDASWTLVPADIGLALQVTDSSAPASLLSPSLYNHAAQIRFHLTSGTLVWNFRQSAVGQYTVTLDTNGQLHLLRTGQVVASQYAGIVFPDQWRTVRLSAIADVIRIAVDGAELITFVDSTPLPLGTLAFNAVFPPPVEGVEQPPQTLQLDDLIVWIPTAEWTPSPTFTPTISLTPSATPEVTEVPTEETTPETTAEVTEVPTEETTAEFTDVPTEETTPEVTDEPLPDEPPFALLYSDNFDAGATLLWTLGTSWTFTPTETGQALQASASDDPTTFLYDDLYNVVAEASFQFTSGAAQLHARRSEVGDYTASLTSSGEVTLYRGQTAIGTASVPTDAAWRVVRLSVIEDVLRVSVDGMPVIALRDSAPLPPGLVGFSGHELSESGLRVDDFSLWLPASDLGVTPTITPTLTPTPTLETLPPEPELTLILEDAFDSGDLSNWTMDAGWMLVAEPLPTVPPIEATEVIPPPEVTVEAVVGEAALSPEIAQIEPLPEVTLEIATPEVTAVAVSGQMLQAVNAATPLTLNHDPLRNVVVQADVLIMSGVAQINVHQSETGAYTVHLYADGQVELYRSDVLVRAATVSPSAGQWQTVRIAAIENGVRVSINGIDVITFLDVEPLPAGSIAFASVASETTSSLLLDNFKLWIPTAELLTPTPVPEPPLQVLYSDNFDNGSLYPWMITTNWHSSYSFSGMAIETWISNEPVPVIENVLENVATEITFYLVGGNVRLRVRESEAGAYTVTLNPLGEVSLYRGEELLQTAPIAPTETWQYRKLRLSAIDNTLRVSVDGVEVIMLVDTEPLPAGTMSFDGVFEEGNPQSNLSVDDVTVLVPVEEFAVTRLDVLSFADVPMPTPPPQMAAMALLQTESSCGDIPYPLTPNWVAYSDWEGGNYPGAHREEIRINDLNCSTDDDGIKVLGHPTDFYGEGQEIHPAISPDGTRIAFASNCYDNFEIYVVDLENIISRINASDPTFDPDTSFTCDVADRLTDTPSSVSNQHPVWSPDGTRIAFQRNDGSLGWKIWIMDALDGGNAHRLTDVSSNIGEIEPAWSPDGRQIAFTTMGCGPDMDIYRADAYSNTWGGSCTSPLIQGPGNDQHPDWSPDGRFIAYTSRRDVYPDVYISSTTVGEFLNDTTPANDDGPAINLTNTLGGPGTNVNNYHPAWSPDGTQIVIVSNYFYGGNNTYATEISITTSPDSLDIYYVAYPTPRSSFFWISDGGIDMSPYVECPNVADYSLVTEINTNFATRKACLMEYRGAMFFVIAHELSLNEYLSLDELYHLSNTSLSYSQDTVPTLRRPTPEEIGEFSGAATNYNHRYLYARVTVNGVVTAGLAGRNPVENFFITGFGEATNVNYWYGGNCQQLQGNRCIDNVWYNDALDNVANGESAVIPYTVYRELMPNIAAAVHDEIRNLADPTNDALEARSANVCFTFQAGNFSTQYVCSVGLDDATRNQIRDLISQGVLPQNFMSQFVFGVSNGVVVDFEQDWLYTGARPPSTNPDPSCFINESIVDTYNRHLDQLYVNTPPPVGNGLEAVRNVNPITNTHVRFGLWEPSVHIHALRVEPHKINGVVVNPNLITNLRWVTFKFTARGDMRIIVSLNAPAPESEFLTFNQGEPIPIPQRDCS